MTAATHSYTSLFAGASIGGMGYASMHFSNVAKNIDPVNGPGMAVTLGGVAMVTGLYMAVDGFVKPLFASTFRGVHRFLTTYSLRNDTAIAGHLVTHGLATAAIAAALKGSLKGKGDHLLTPEMATKAAYWALGASAVGAAYMLWNRKTIRQPTGLAPIARVDTLEITPESPLHMDYPGTYTLGQTKRPRFSSIGAAYTASLFKSQPINWRDKLNMTGKPADEIRQIYLETAADSTLAAERLKEQHSDPAFIDDQLQLVFESKFGYRQTNPTDHQKSCRSALLSTGQSMLVHPDVPTVSGGTISQALMEIRNRLQQENRAPGLPEFRPGGFAHRGF